MAKVKIVKRITDKGYPVHDKKYPSAHRFANAAEKRANKRMFDAEKKAERKLGKHELMATHDKHGNIKIEKKFVKFKPNLIIHEKTEYKKDKGRRK